MNSVKLQVEMLGSFTIRYGERSISDSDNRSHKVWLLLAYMIYHHNRTITQDELVRLLWGEEGSSNPQNALKTMFHRARSLLDQLYPGAGHDLIIRQGGNYAWNPDSSFLFDVEEFDSLCRYCTTEEDQNTRIGEQVHTLELYSDHFLPKFSSEPWVVPVATYYHNQYTHLALDTLALLEQEARHMELVDLCRRIIQLEPYEETIYQYLMRGLLALGDQQAAINAYQDMGRILYDNFGIMPTDESRNLYRTATKTVNQRSVSLEAVREQLREPEGPGGALVCDYDFFKILYHAEARSVARTGDAVHLCFFSVTSRDGQPLAKRSLDLCMDNLQDVIRCNLRRGDIVSRYSASQFITMLLQANYENSCMVCDRVIRAFYRRYPHSPADIQFTVQALEPNV